MNKKGLIIAGAFVVCVFLVYFLFIFMKKKNANTLELTYKTNGGVPYKWEYEIKDKDIVEFVGTKDITSKEDKELDGGSISTNYIFKGKKKGATSITFKYVSITTGEVDKEETVNVKVDMYNHISLVVNTK